MINTMPFEAWHVEAIAEDPALPFSGDDDIVQRLLLFSRAPGTVLHTLVFMHNGKVEILGVIGLHVYWAHVAETFTFLSKKIKMAPRSFSREVRRVMNFYIKNLKLKRLHTYVREGFSEAMAWAKFMGFEIEGLMKNFGPEGASYFLMAKYGGEI